MSSPHRSSSSSTPVRSRSGTPRCSTVIPPRRPVRSSSRKKLDPRSGETKEENPTFLKTGDAAIVQLKPTHPMVIENVKDLPQLGRFAIRDMGSTIAAGVCIAIQPKQMR